MGARKSARVVVALAVTLAAVLVPVPGWAQGRAPRTRLQFRAEIATAQGAVAACAREAAGCALPGFPAADEVRAEGGHAGFGVDWSPLLNGLQQARGAAPAQRAETMRQAGAVLAGWAQEADASQGTAVEAQRARSVAAGVLARPEFARVPERPSWWRRRLQAAEDWLFHLLSGMGVAGSRHPWLAPAIEWTCFALGAAALLVSVLRNLRRQGLRLRLEGTSEMVEPRSHKADEWMRAAGEHAAAARWRDGVHCLYWAAILSLEARRAWRPSATRTPREYLRLLPPGGDAQRALRVLTGSLERLWYGQGTATEADFRAAEVLHGRVLTAGVHAGPAGEGSTMAGAAS